MAIDLHGLDNSLFERLGRLGVLLNNVNGLVGEIPPDVAAAWGASGPTIECLDTAVSAIRDGYLEDSTDLIGQLYVQRDAYRDAHGSLKSYLAGFGSDLLIRMADDDTDLPSKDILTALRELVKQMRASVDSVPRPTITATVTTGAANEGDAVCVASVLGPDGVQRDYIYAETLDLLCTLDSQQGSTLGQEQWSVLGDSQQGDKLAWDWPRGSGASTSVASGAADEDAGANLLTNSDFEDFDSNTPDQWEIVLGTAGTTVFEATGADAYGATGSALKITGTGAAELTSLTQEFEDSTDGTAASLQPLTVYALSGRFKRTAGAAAGVLDVELYNGTAVINDEAVVANRLRLTIASDLTTSYTSHTAFFRTPAVLPATAQLRVRLSTAVTSGESVFADHLCLTAATEVYPGGPFLAVFSGATKSIVDDTFSVAVANDYSSRWQKFLWRIFDLPALGLAIPSHATLPTVSDTLLL